MNPNSAPQLLAIVEVPSEERVFCGQHGCGHTVWKAIHVVKDGVDLLVLGSTCFQKRYGNGPALGTPQYGGGGESRKLTSEERQLLAENTAELLARFEEEERLRAEALAAAQAKEKVEAVARLATLRLRAEALAATRAKENAAAAARLAVWSRPVPSPASAPRAALSFAFPSGTASPCSWMKPGTSLGYFQLRDGSGWVRVQRNDGQQVLVPWPADEGWDEALPAHIGCADQAHGGYLVADVRAVVAYLRSVGNWDRVFGSWNELIAQVGK